MSNTHKNDKQPRGFRDTVEKAQERILEQKLAKKVTFRDLFTELAAFEQRVNLHLQFIYDNVPGLREKLDAKIAENKKATELQTEGHSPIPTPEEIEQLRAEAEKPEAPAGGVSEGNENG